MKSEENLALHAVTVKKPKSDKNKEKYGVKLL